MMNGRLVESVVQNLKKIELFCTKLEVLSTSLKVDRAKNENVKCSCPVC